MKVAVFAFGLFVPFSGVELRSKQEDAMSWRRATIRSIVSHKPRDGANTRVPKHWLLLAWVSLLAISVLNLIIYIIGTPIYFAQLYPSHHQCFQECLTP